MSTTQKQQRLAEWFGLWGGPLRRFLNSRRSIPRADVDDVAQEVFLRLMRYDRSDAVEHPQAYLFRMASNVASDWAIRSRHRYPHEPEWLAALPAVDLPDESLTRSGAEEQVKRAIDRLPERQRRIIKLRFAEGLGQSETAARLQTTERVVKRDLKKSYAALRRELNPDLLGPLTQGRE